MPPDVTQMTLLLKENNKLLKENNEILKKMRRGSIIAFWIRIVTFLFILGLPFAFYFYVVEPYVASTSETIESMVNDKIESFLDLDAFKSGLFQRNNIPEE